MFSFIMEKAKENKIKLKLVKKLCIFKLFNLCIKELK